MANGIVQQDFALAAMPTALDLFSGCGGLTLGLKQAGFNVQAAVEIDPLANATYESNHKDVTVWQADIRDLDPVEVRSSLQLDKGELDLLAGCPPCQGFSKLRTLNGFLPVDDPRNDLLFEVLRFVEEFKPRAVMIENVPALATDSRFDNFYRRMENFGYLGSSRILDASDYGVPQRRRRLIYVAGLGIEIPFAEPTHKLMTVRNAIGALPRAGQSGDAIHDIPEQRTSRIMELIQRIPKDGGGRAALPWTDQLPCHKRCDGFKDVYGRMAWDSVAPTITTGCFNPSKGRFLHPEEDRGITMREAALLQGFPSRYKFPMTAGKVAVALMIGNALPPPFIAAHAGMIRKALWHMDTTLWPVGASVDDRNAMDSKDICFRLLRCESEREVDAVVESVPELADPQNWHPIDGRVTNFNVVTNQASTGSKALTELCTNMVDAVLLKHAHIRGPTGPEAPKSVIEGVRDLVGLKGARSGILAQVDDPKYLQQFAEDNLVIGVTGGTKREESLCFTFVDNGEGQRPSDFEDTFLSLSKGNKSNIPFVQGKYNMGSSGVLTYCGRRWYKLIVSRRYDARGDWGWTLVRRRPADGMPVAEYFKPSRIPSFSATAIHPLRLKSGEVDRKVHPATGTIVKLYDYNMESTASFRQIRESLNENLVSTVLPIRLMDYRYPPDLKRGGRRAQGVDERPVNGMEFLLLRRDGDQEAESDAEVRGDRPASERSIGNRSPGPGPYFSAHNRAGTPTTGMVECSPKHVQGLPRSQRPSSIQGQSRVSVADVQTPRPEGSNSRYRRRETLGSCPQRCLERG